MGLCVAVAAQDGSSSKREGPLTQRIVGSALPAGLSRPLQQRPWGGLLEPGGQPQDLHFQRVLRRWLNPDTPAGVTGSWP